MGWRPDHLCKRLFLNADAVEARAAASRFGSSDQFNPGLVQGEQLEDEESFVPTAIGLAGESLELVVDAFQHGA